MCQRHFSVVTLGCKVNQYEGEELAASLEGAGLVRSEPEIADLILVNTCTVTDVAVSDSVRTVRNLNKAKPTAEIVVTGCAATSDSEKFSAISGVSRIIGNDLKKQIPSLLGVQNDAIGGIKKFTGHTRAFVKVQDGCDLSCSFCIIPMVRGKSRSRPIDDIVREIRHLTSVYSEVVLTGVHLGLYGHDLDRSLHNLISAILEQTDVKRLRLSSIECHEISDEIIGLMKSNPRFVPHLHIPLQAGDDTILRGMRRRYNTRQFENNINRLKDAVPEIGLTTDVIVGFPGETEKLFENTVRFVQRIGFHRLHIFPYSPRKGTDAAKSKDMPGRFKKARLHRLAEVGEELRDSYYSRFVGREVSVLVERDSSGYSETYMRCRLNGTFERNAIVRARGVSVECGILNCIAGD